MFKLASQKRPNVEEKLREHLAKQVGAGTDPSWVGGQVHVTAAWLLPMMPVFAPLPHAP